MGIKARLLFLLLLAASWNNAPFAYSACNGHHAESRFTEAIEVDYEECGEGCQTDENTVENAQKRPVFAYHFTGSRSIFRIEIERNIVTTYFQIKSAHMLLDSVITQTFLLETSNNRFKLIKKFDMDHHGLHSHRLESDSLRPHAHVQYLYSDKIDLIVFTDIMDTIESITDIMVEHKEACLLSYAAFLRESTRSKI